MSMTAQSPITLADIGIAVRESLGSAAMFQVLTTRLIIQFGVDLKAPAPEQNTDPALIRRVQEALQRMGIRAGDKAP
jgi:hypothetical protein